MAPGRSTRPGSAAHKNLAEPDGDDSWDDSDEEAQQKPAWAGSKRKAPRAAAGGADGQPQPAKRRTKQAVDVHELTLLEIIYQHSHAMDQAVKEWVERYKSNRAAAAAELMTLLVKACGVDEELSEEEVEGGEVDAIAQRLTQLVQEEGGVNLFTSTRQGRLFAEHYRRFWDKVLRALAAADLLFDDFELNDKLTRLVTALNISQVRPFRHAATLTAAQLVSSWIAVSRGLAESRNLTQAQLDAEERKKGKAHNQGVINGLRRTLERTHARVEDLRNFRSLTFSGVFSHRFRDVSEDIRSIVIEAIGEWVEALPSEFLGDSYLKYLAWALSDRAPLVRLQAVKAITKLYSERDNVPRLQDLSQRFNSRFCELMHDVEGEVAAAGLQMLAVLVEHGVVKHQDVSGVYMLLMMPSAELRSAAAGLVVQLLEEQGREALEATAERLKAAAASAAPPAAKGRGRPSKAKAAAQGSGAAAAAAAAALLEDSSKVKLAGLVAVMGRLASAEPLGGSTATAGEERSRAQMSQASIGQAAADGSTAGAGPLPTLPQADVSKLVDALWGEMHDELSDIRGLAACLADDSAIELWGKVGTAHLASLLTAAAHTHIFGGAARTAGGRKGRMARGRAAAAAEGAAPDEDAQQEVTVLMIEQLPALLTMYQAEPLVVAPLLAIPRLLRVELYLLRGASEAYRALLGQVDGLLHRHTQQSLIIEAAGALVYASKAGPEALQEIGRQALSTTSSTAAAKLAAAASAVSKLSAPQLAEGVADLAEAPEEAPDALHSLLTGARRVYVLLAAGSSSLAKDTQLNKTCQALLQQVLQGRELGPDITSLLLHISSLRLMWQLAATVAAGDASDTAALNAYVQQRGAFAKVLEALLESGATEKLVTPQQLLSQQWWATSSAHPRGSQGGGAGAHSSSSQVPPELAEQLSVGLQSLQDLAFLLLTDLLFLENGNVAAATAAAAQQQQGGGRRGAAAAAGGGFGQMSLSSGVLERLWRYCCGVLEREGPEVPAAGEGGDDDQMDEDDPIEEDDVFDEYDAEGAAARRAARAAARRSALAAAAASLDSLKQRVLLALSRLLGYRVLPEPGFSWLLSHSITLLDGYGPQASTSVRGLLVHLKSTSRDGGLVSHLVEGLTLLYEEAQEQHGDEEPTLAAGHHRGDRQDPTSWAHVAAVSSKLAGIFQGHNLSQVVLGSLLDQGLNWTMEEPLGRAAFPLLCLGPFLAKLSPSEGERVAQGLAARLGDREGLPGLGGEEVEGGEGEEARQQLEAFLGHLQERAAGKKITRGVLKTPARAAAAAAADADADDEEQEADAGPGGDAADADVAAAAATKSGKGKGGRRKGSRIRFAPDVEASDQDGDGEPPAAAAAAAAGRGGSRAAARPGTAAAAAGKRGGGDGWVAKQKGSPAAAGKQPAARSRRQQQQRGQAAAATAVSDEELEDAVEEQQQQEEEEPEQQQPRGRRGAAAPRGRQAAAAAMQSQSQSQSQGRSSGRRRHLQQQQPADSDAASAGGFEGDEQEQYYADSKGAAAAGGSGGGGGSLLARSQEGEEEEEGAPDFFSAEQLPGMGRPRGRQQQQSQRGRGRGAAAAAAAAGGADSGDDEEMLDADQQQEQYEEEGEGEEAAAGDQGGWDSDDNSMGEGGQLMQTASQSTLPSLQVMVDDDPDMGEEVDEPPPTRRFGRRR